MAKDPVADRYARTFFELAKGEGRIEEALQGLEELASLIQHHEELRQFLFNPGIEVADKLSVLERLLHGSWSSELRAFVQLVLSMARVSFLTEMVGAFREAVDADRRLLRVTVRSAHPLSEALKTQLKHRLEQLEDRTVELTEELAPDLIGGVQVFLGHRILDGSLRTKLTTLRHRLKSVRVH